MNLLLQKIDDLPDPQNVYEARLTKLLYDLEFEIRTLKERVIYLERWRANADF
jgi:hypothetical protein